MNKQKDIFISIIIPVYNTPKDYFEKCIESIMTTKYPFYEIVVVDDGSSVSNSNEYQEMCSKYEKIRYFLKKNGGVSSARNYGIRQAKGKYITFVDSDDIVTSKFLTEAAALAEKYNSDVVFGTMKYEGMPWHPQGADEEVYLPLEKISSLKKCFLGIPQSDIPHDIIGSSCGRLYKKEIILGNMFPENMSHSEDQLFNRRIFDFIETAVLVPNIWYIYNQNDFSAMHNALSGKYIEKLSGFFDEWESMNEQEADEEIRIKSRVKSIEFFYAAVNEIVIQENCTFFKRIKKIAELYDLGIFANMVKELPLNCSRSNYERFKLFLIKHKMKYMIYFLVYARRKMR